MTPSWKRIPRAVAATVALDTAPFGVLWVDEEGFISYVNKHLEVHLGLSSQEALGQPISFITHFWGNGNWKDTVWPKTANGIIQEQVSEWQARTGPSISFNTTIHRIQVAGQEVAVHYLTHPVTRNHQSLALGLLPEFTESWKNGLVVVTDLLEVEQTNSAFIRLLGIDSDAAIGRNIAEIILQNEGCESPWIRLKNQGLDDFLVTYLSPAGQTLNLALSSRNDRNSEATRYFIFVEDRSEQVQLKQMLAQQKHSLEAMSAHTPGMIYKFTLSPEGKASFPYASPGVRDIWEVDPLEIVNDATPILRLIHADDIGPFQQSVMESATTLSAWDFEGRIITQSGKQKWFHAASRPELDGDGNIVWQGLLMDITHQKSLEQELKVAMVKAESASKAKSQFLANMSHELRTPLNAIIGYSEMLQEEADDLGTPEIKPDLQKIHGAGKHLLGLINDILDLSKIEAGKMTLYLETFEVQTLLNEVAATVQPMINKNGNQLTLEVAPEIGSMRADVTKVRQALFNLLSNASKFTDKGSITLRAGRQGADLVFDVIDSGIGMTTEQVGRLFQAFAQADASTSKKYGGTGLGLALSRKFCQLMGGDLTVASEAGKGSTFTAIIPAQVIEVAEETIPTLSAPAAEIASTGSGPLVLVIDDDATVQDLLRRSLNRDGFRVETAPDGTSGLARARKLHPDIITLDVMMPGMDGWEVLAALKEDPETADIPVIVVSIVDERGLGFSLGAADYLTKPLDFSRLSSVLNRHAKVGLGRRVLIVEDDEATQELLQKRLTKEGWQVLVAGNGREALERLTQGPPDLVLLDLMMPEMDGFEFLEAFRKQPGCARTTVVVMTAKILTPADHQRLRGQVAQVVAKANLSPEMLAAEIRSALGKTLPRPRSGANPGAALKATQP